MKNVFGLIPQLLAGRSGPAYEPWSLSELRAGGFDVVLNLTEVEPSRAEFAEAQLEVAWIPFPSTYPPNLETEKLCLAALLQAHEILQSVRSSPRTRPPAAKPFR